MIRILSDENLTWCAETARCGRQPVTPQESTQAGHGQARARACCWELRLLVSDLKPRAWSMSSSMPSEDLPKGEGRQERQHGSGHMREGLSVISGFHSEDGGRGQEPRNAGSLYIPGKARERIHPKRLQKPHGSADALRPACGTCQI